MKKSGVKMMANALHVTFIAFLALTLVDMTFLGQSRQGIALAGEGTLPADHVQQPDPSSLFGGEVIEITDPQGRKVVIREKGYNNKEFIQIKGKVIMTRGDDVTIQLEEKDQRVTAGDRVELSFSVDGEVIPVGTWRVSKVKEDGTVEAEMFNKIVTPSVGMDALVFIQTDRSEPLQEAKASAERQEKTDRRQPAQTEQDKKSVAREAKPTSIEEALAPYSRTAVPIDYSNYGNSLSCEFGTIRFHPERIEMAASGKSEWEHCIFKVSDDLFENFIASFYVTVDTNSHHSFYVGIVYGNKPGGVQESDSIRGSILAFSGKRSTGLFKSKWRYLTSLTAKYPAKEDKGKITKFLPEDTNPTPGTLTLMKTGTRCRIYWNGEEIGTWNEETILNGHVWLEFMAHGRGRIIATFKDIRIDRLY